MRRRHPFMVVLVLLLSVSAFAGSAHADCPGNLLANPGFEEGDYKTEVLGTSLSSNLGNGWVPWSILGDATRNREVEYKTLLLSALPDGFYVRGGRRAQKFFTTWGTHTAGFYQRVKVTPGSKVVFSIWVKIYSGERELPQGGHFISDLDWPKQGEHQGPGLYRVSVGIDPRGATPVGFGAMATADTWAAPLTEFDTRVTDASGQPTDAWVQLSVSAIAQGDYVTVYTRGQPEYAVKHNDSFWDDACLVMQAPPTPTRRPTDPPSPTLVPTKTFTASPTPPPTATPQPTATPVPPTATPVPPTATPQPTATPIPPTATPQPTAVPPTPVPPTAVPSPQPTPVPARASAGAPGWLLLYAGGAGLIVAIVVWLVRRRRG